MRAPTADRAMHHASQYGGTNADVTSLPFFIDNDQHHKTITKGRRKGNSTGEIRIARGDDCGDFDVVFSSDFVEIFGTTAVALLVDVVETLLLLLL